MQPQPSPPWWGLLADNQRDPWGLCWGHEGPYAQPHPLQITEVGQSGCAYTAPRTSPLRGTGGSARPGTRGLLTAPPGVTLGCAAAGWAPGKSNYPARPQFQHAQLGVPTSPWGEQLAVNAVTAPTSYPSIHVRAQACPWACTASFSLDHRVLHAEGTSRGKAGESGAGTHRVRGSSVSPGSPITASVSPPAPGVGDGVLTVAVGPRSQG